MGELPPPLDKSVIWPHPLPAILAIAERGITAADIATMTLWAVSPDAPASEVKSALLTHGYDVAPVREEIVWRYVSLEHLNDDDQPISRLAVPIRAYELVHESLGLVRVIDALKARPFLFVLQGYRLGGIVTRSDIQRSPVTMAALALVLAMEQGLKELVRVFAAETWSDHVKPDRLDSINAILESRRRFKVEIDVFECIMLADLFDIAMDEPSIQGRLGISKTSIAKKKARVVDARDSMAHGGSLLSPSADPVSAIGLFGELRGFAELVWSVLAAKEDRELE